MNCSRMSGSQGRRIGPAGRGARRSWHVPVCRPVDGVDGAEPGLGTRRAGDGRPGLRGPRTNLPSLVVGRGAACVALCAAMHAVSGCGPAGPHADRPRSDVVIVVTSGGAPVVAGTINLLDEATGEGGGGTLTATGRATISGVSHGTYVVTVVPVEEIVVPNESDVGGAAPIRPGGPTLNGVPARFRSAQTSPLRVTVGSDGEILELDLQDTPP